jgi:hypothetical protein
MIFRNLCTSSPSDDCGPTLGITCEGQRGQVTHYATLMVCTPTNSDSSLSAILGEHRDNLGVALDYDAEASAWMKDGLLTRASLRASHGQGHISSGPSLGPPYVGPTLEISCEAPSWLGFVSFNSLLGCAVPLEMNARHELCRDPAPPSVHDGDAQTTVREMHDTLVATAWEGGRSRLRPRRGNGRLRTCMPRLCHLRC